MGVVKPITVVLVDDHAMFRCGLRELLELHEIEVLGDVPTAEEGLELVEQHAPDVAIMDLGLGPGMSGLEAIRRMVAGAPRTRVLVLTVSESEEDVIDAVLVGGSGYLLKDTPSETIVAGVRAAAAGEAMVSPKMAATVLERLRANGPRAASPEAELSERETEVLRLVAAGHDNEQIAGELFISPHTVKNHISSILLKLQVANRIQAAVRAVRDEMI